MSIRGKAFIAGAYGLPKFRPARGEDDDG